MSAIRLARMHGHGKYHWADLTSWEDYRQAVSSIAALEIEPELDLHDDGPA
ncbi:MAG: hypothetical protein HKP13_05965 [Gammaproteobacteria bacterium]|nr:hypothetical protein [Gammaproteobacteria bacterium]